MKTAAGSLTTLAVPAVILAAGLGSRLAGPGGDLPKALVPVLGRPLLDYTLRGLALAGVREVHVVVGHRGEQVCTALRHMDVYGLEIGVVNNPYYALANGSSLAAARQTVAGRPFLLLMADHLLSAEAIDCMLQSGHGFAIGVDRGPLSPARLADATRVQIGAGGLVRAFGKQLSVWNGIDAGVFRCLPAVFDVIDDLGLDRELSVVMTAVAARYPFHAIDLSGAFWLDVDTPADVIEAERLLQDS